MTVRELIALLVELPSDLPVYLGDWNEGYEYDHPLEHEDKPRIMGPTQSVKSSHSLPSRVVIGRGR